VADAEPSEAVGRAITPAELPAAFAQGWVLSKPDAFLDFFMPLVHEDAVFIQPMLAEARGHAQIDAMFRRLFRLMPEFVAVPRRCAVEGDVVFIESQCVAAVAGTRVRFVVCDRFVLADGRICERRTFFDPSPVVRVLARRPWLWPRALRSRRGSG
jgi:ketosteroid isomerase-like protein